MDPMASSGSHPPISGRSKAPAAPHHYYDNPTYRSVSIFLSSGLASMLSRMLLYPLDTYKTLRQIELSNIASTSVITSGQGKPFAGVRLVLDKLKGNPALIYKGFWVSVLLSIPSQSLYMCVYDNMKTLFMTRKKNFSANEVSAPVALAQENQAKDKKLGEAVSKNLTSVHIAASAAVANCMAAFIRAPAEQIKQTCQSGKYATWKQAVTSIWSTQKLYGFYRGLGAEILRDVPYAMCLFVSLEYFRSLGHKRSTDERSGTSVRSVLFSEGSVFVMFPAAMAGLIATVVTTPLDVIKSRVMVDEYPIYRAIMTVCSNPSVAMRGVIPRVIHKVPAASLYLTSYQLILHHVFHVQH